MSKRLTRLTLRGLTAATAPLAPRVRAQVLAGVASALDEPMSVATERGALILRKGSAQAVDKTIRFDRYEPETRAWLDAVLEPGDTFWDIGANVGTFSLYAALGRDVAVYAFEPAAASFAMLVENVALNGLDRKIKPLCIALSDKTELGALRMHRHRSAGSAGHVFGEGERQWGEVAEVFSQAVPAFSVDGFRDCFSLDAPDHIKLDVDSIEEQILKGAKETLPQVRSVAVEIEGTNDQGAESPIRTLLHEAGFKERSFCDRPTRNVFFVREA